MAPPAGPGSAAEEANAGQYRQRVEPQNYWQTGRIGGTKATTDEFCPRERNPQGDERPVTRADEPEGSDVAHTMPDTCLVDVAETKGAGCYPAHMLNVDQEMKQ